MDGLLLQGSYNLSSRIGSQGFCLEYNWKILKPNLTLEWATLSWLSPKGLPIGQISSVADGPSGCYFISYQNP